MECPTDSAHYQEMRATFATELGMPMFNNEPVAIILFNMITKFCNGTAPHFPIKKVLLLLWKTVLVCVGYISAFSMILSVVHLSALWASLEKHNMRHTSPILYSHGNKIWTLTVFIFHKFFSMKYRLSIYTTVCTSTILISIFTYTGVDGDAEGALSD